MITRLQNERIIKSSLIPILPEIAPKIAKGELADYGMLCSNHENQSEDIGQVIIENGEIKLLL